MAKREGSVHARDLGKVVRRAETIGRLGGRRITESVGPQSTFENGGNKGTGAGTTRHPRHRSVGIPSKRV